MNGSDAHVAVGLAAHRDGRLSEAEAAYRRAVDADPGDAAALHLLGVVAHQLGDGCEAVGLIGRAIAIRPGVAAFHNNLGEALRGVDRFADAVTAYRRALHLRPDYPEALNNLGGACGQLNRLPEAIDCLTRAVALRPADAEAHWNLSTALLLAGRWTEGWEQFEWRRPPGGEPPRQFDRPTWDGRPLPGRTLLLWAEQGFGDVIQFVRCVPLVRHRVGRVVLEAPVELLPLLAAQGLADAVVPLGTLPPFDVQLPLLSLPRLLGTTPTTVPAGPYIRPPTILPFPTDGTRRIGLAWAGRPTHPNDRRRSIPPDLLRPLADVPGVTFVTVQPTGVAPPAGLRWVDAGARLATFADTAGLLASLDLLISVDTAVAHLAGAMGRPVWTLLPLSADWRWLAARPDDTPWYPTMRLFRQRQIGDWGEVIGRVAAALTAFALV